MSRFDFRMQGATVMATRNGVDAQAATDAIERKWRTVADEFKGDRGFGAFQVAGAER